MAKVSPIQSVFSAGEWSQLMAGRVDNDHYGASVRSAFNCAPIAQGPIMRRSGTKYIAPVRDHTKKSRLIPFENSVDDAFMLGFSDGKMRVLDETGAVLRASVAVTAVSFSGAAVVTAPGHGASVGDYVFCSGFAATSALNGAFAKVTGIAGDNLTLEAIAGVTGAPTLTGNERVARVYEIDAPYSDVALQTLRTVQSADVLFTFQGSVSMRALARYGALDWRSAALELRDGPYMSPNNTGTRLTPSATGDAIPDTVSAGNVTSSGDDGTNLDEYAFGIDASTFWDNGTAQTGWVAYQFPTAKIITGYTLYLAKAQPSSTIGYKDYAPLTWTFEGWDGSAWVVLDRQADYILYDGGRSQFFQIDNDTAYIKYRINVEMVALAGTNGVRLARIAMAEKVGNAPSVTFTASSTVGINRDQGFLSTDVGRVLRFKGVDGPWRWYRIVERTSSTVIKCQAQSDPLYNKQGSTEWRLGLWSDTTGYPTCGHFFGDRLWMGGSFGAPDTLVGTKVGGYSPAFLELSPSDPDGVVNPDNSIVAVLTARKVGAIRWITSDDRGLLVGTLNGNWTLRAADQNSPMSATNVEARPTSARGSQDVEAVSIDEQVLYVQRGGRAVRELAYSADVDGYKAPSMSLYSSHIGTSPLMRLAFASEPHSILWCQKEDGTYAGFTYNREEGVLGWHRHGLGGDSVVVEDVAVLPSIDGVTDATWFIVKRTINGETRRYYEVLQPFYDFGDTFEDDAFYFDCGQAYEGAPVDTVSGAWHLEGQQVGVLADGSPVAPVTIENGSFSIQFPAKRIVFGLMYDALIETVRPNSGAADGTAQGKTKRANNVTVRLWETGGGQYGRANPNIDGGMEWVDFVFASPDDVTDERVPPFTGDYGPFEWPLGYDSDGTFFFRQPGSIGLPFNVVAIMPQLVTQDR
ncbi:hypothetical protein [Hyphomicrobium sp. DY-1]|uniref:hypothetical protein n=1 Tax=Hyphomicrobium sp. DY-1 TaxID=3075650 RepID=UPI0039C2A642